MLTAPIPELSSEETRSFPEHTYPTGLHTHLKTRSNSNLLPGSCAPSLSDAPFNSSPEAQQMNSKSYKYKPSEIINVVPRQKLQSKI